MTFRHFVCSTRLLLPLDPFPWLTKPPTYFFLISLSWLRGFAKQEESTVNILGNLSFSCTWNTAQTDGRGGRISTRARKMKRSKEKGNQRRANSRLGFCFSWWDARKCERTGCYLFRRASPPKLGKTKSKPDRQSQIEKQSDSTEPTLENMKGGDATAVETGRKSNETWWTSRILDFGAKSTLLCLVLFSLNEMNWSATGCLWKFGR